MDELKLKLQTKFMRGIVAKLIGAAIQKKVQLHVDIDADMTNGEFTRLVNSILY